MMTAKKLVMHLAGILALACVGTAAAVDITGAGATFPYAVYTKWAESYKVETGNSVNYQGIGSSGGIKQIKAKTVDFGGTDAPLKGEELDAANLIQVPTVMGGVTLVVNLPGVESGQLKLDGPTAADIFRGAIGKWNDPAIVKLNPGLALPKRAIILAYRSDGSGTTHVFTHYLAKQSALFKQEIGAGKSVNWPANGVGGKGNSGVAANVGKIRGAIGYVDISDATKAGMRFVALKNKAGNFVLPSQNSIKAAAAGVNFNIKGMAPDLLDQANKEAWPIASSTYILVYARGANPVRQKGVVDFVSWALNKGQKLVEGLGFVALPAPVVKTVESELKKIK